MIYTDRAKLMKSLEKCLAIAKAVDSGFVYITVGEAKAALRLLAEGEPESTSWVKELDRVNHWHCLKCGYVEGCVSQEYKYCPHCGRKVKQNEDN